jgi:autoinducer 2-degrading protein
MTRFVVLAQFRIKPGKRERFVELAMVDAEAAVANEPGCRRFDVLIPHESSQRVVLSEIYDDRAAFDAHLKTPHLAAFRKGIAELIDDRRIETFEVHEHSKP